MRGMNSGRRGLPSARRRSSSGAGIGRPTHSRGRLRHRAPHHRAWIWTAVASTLLVGTVTAPWAVGGRLPWPGAPRRPHPEGCRPPHRVHRTDGQRCIDRAPAGSAGRPGERGPFTRPHRRDQDRRRRKQLHVPRRPDGADRPVRRRSTRPGPGRALPDIDAKITDLVRALNSRGPAWTCALSRPHAHRLHRRADDHRVFRARSLGPRRLPGAAMADRSNGAGRSGPTVGDPARPARAGHVRHDGDHGCAT